MATPKLTPCQFAPEFAPNAAKTRTLQSIMDKIASEAEKRRASGAVATTAYPVKRKDPLTTAVNGSHLVEPTGIEPATSWLQTRALSQLSYGPSGASTRCTGLFVWHI